MMSPKSRRQRFYAALLGSAAGLSILICSPAQSEDKKDTSSADKTTTTTTTTTATTETSPPEAKPEPTEAETITVIGSRIRRKNYNIASPVQTISRDESTLRGLTTATEILQGNGAAAGAAQINNFFGNFVTNGGPGANTLGLRGLGATRTLVLLNGRRLAPAGTRGGVGSADLNVLPNAIVDTIEILKDGASSVYGSDAVAGVVDIETFKDVTGLTFEGQYNKTQHGGGDQARFSVVGGLNGDGWKISGSLEYYERANLTLGDRDWTKCNTDYLPDPAGGFDDDIDPLTGKPKCYPITFGANNGSNGVTINTIGTRSYNNPGNVAAAGTSGTSFNRWRPNSAVTTGLTGFEGVSGPGGLNVRDTFEPRMLNQSLVSPERTYTAFAQGTKDLNMLGNAQAYFEFLFSQRNSSQTGYRQLSLDYPAGSPLIPASLVGLETGLAENPHPGVTGIRAFIGYGNDDNSQKVGYWKLVGGVRGNLPFGDWQYDGTATYSRADADYTFQSFIWSRVTASLNSCGPAPGLDPSFDFSNCVVAPPLTSQTIGGILPDAYKNYIFIPVTGNTFYDEADLTAITNGTIFALPAGNLQGVLGVEYRNSDINDQPPSESVAGDLYNLTSAVVTKGSDNVFEAFGELEAPILKDLFLVKELRFNVSGRYTDYASYGAGETYKLSSVYAPVSWLTLHATYGTSYRAPALFEQFQGATTGFLSQTVDPCNDYGSKNPASNVYQNCATQIVGGVPLSPSFTQLNGITDITAGGAGSGLKAETSKNFTFGGIFHPALNSFYGDLSLEVDYYDINLENEVTQVGGNNILDLCYNEPTAQFAAGGGFCNLVEPRDPVQGALTVHDDYVNIAKQIVRGVEYTARYVRDVGPGTLRLDIDFNQYVAQKQRTFPTDPMLSTNGLLTWPANTAEFDATYDYNNLRFRYGFSWFDAMDEDNYEGITKGVDPFIFHTPPYWLHDLSMEYKGPENWTFVAGVRNLADTNPPPVSAGGVNPKVGNAVLYSQYDYVGRQFFVNITKKFGR